MTANGQRDTTRGLRGPRSLFTMPRRPLVVVPARRRPLLGSERTSGRCQGPEELTSTVTGDDVHVRHVSHTGEPAEVIAAYAQLAMAAVIVIVASITERLDGGGVSPCPAAAVDRRLRRAIPVAAARQVDARVTTGDPAPGILYVASGVDADLIVIGVPPRRRVGEALFGSTLRGVVRRATIPVLVLPIVAGAHEWLVGTTP